MVKCEGHRFDPGSEHSLLPHFLFQNFFFVIKNEENKENIINKRLNIVCCGLFLYNNIFNGFILSCIFFS